MRSARAIRTRKVRGTIYKGELRHGLVSAEARPPRGSVHLPKPLAAGPARWRGGPPSERALAPFGRGSEPRRQPNQANRRIRASRSALADVQYVGAGREVFVLPISTDVWASAVGFGISHKRLLNPKVLVNEANAGHVLAPPAVETNFGPRERAVWPSPIHPHMRRHECDYALANPVTNPGSSRLRASHRPRPAAGLVSGTEKQQAFQGGVVIRPPGYHVRALTLGQRMIC